MKRLKIAFCWRCSEAKWKSGSLEIKENSIVTSDAFLGCRANPVVTWENKDQQCPILLNLKKGKKSIDMK